MAMKKAQLFSMIALMLSLFFILLFSGITRVSLDNDVDQTETQIMLLNDIVLDFPSLVEGAIETSTLRILNFSVDHLNGSNYFPSFPEFFNSCFVNGTFYDYDDLTKKYCSSYGLNVSFNQQLEDVFALTGELYNLNIDVSSIEHDMYLWDAYSLGVNVSVFIDINFSSQVKHIAWQRNIVVSQQVDFIGITDPASIGTNYVRKIRYKPEISGVSLEKRTFTRVGFEGDANLVGEYINNTYYFIDVSGLSIIERMQGNQTTTFNLEDANEFGIATFIPSYNQSGDSLYIANISMIDHHYDWGAKASDSFLRFFNEPSDINRNVTIYDLYVITGMGFSEADLVSVQGHCDANGCEY